MYFINLSVFVLLNLYCWIVVEILFFSSMKWSKEKGFLLLKFLFKNFSVFRHGRRKILQFHLHLNLAATSSSFFFTSTMYWFKYVRELNVGVMGFFFFFVVCDFFCLFCGIGAPLIQKVPLKFCPYNGTSCCNSSDDLQLQNQFRAMNISEPTCATLLKSILCSVIWFCNSWISFLKIGKKKCEL